MWKCNELPLAETDCPATGQELTGRSHGTPGQKQLIEHLLLPARLYLAVELLPAVSQVFQNLVLLLGFLKDTQLEPPLFFDLCHPL